MKLKEIFELVTQFLYYALTNIDRNFKPFYLKKFKSLGCYLEYTGG